jgi:hypothetical protein
MQLRQLFLAAALSLSVLGSKRAGGWEAVLFYDSYRMDYDSHSEADRTIATGCKGAKGGRCNFAEFIEHIVPKTTTIKVDGVRKRVGKFNPANVPSTLDLDNPDPNEASKIMDWKGYPNPNPNVGGDLPGYDATYDKRSLLGPNKSKGKNNHGDVLGAIADVVQESRVAGGSKTDDLLKRLQTTMDQIVLNREMDNAENLMRDFKLKVLDAFNQNLPEDQKLEVKKMDFKDPTTGQTYEIFDSNKMSEDVVNHKGLDKRAKTNLQNKITDYATNYTVKEELSEKAGSSGVTHYRDITAAQAIASRFRGPPGSCS